MYTIYPTEQEQRRILEMVVHGNETLTWAIIDTFDLDGKFFSVEQDINSNVSDIFLVVTKIKVK